MCLFSQLLYFVSASCWWHWCQLDSTHLTQTDPTSGQFICTLLHFLHSPHSGWKQWWFDLRKIEKCRWCRCGTLCCECIMHCLNTVGIWGYTMRFAFQSKSGVIFTIGGSTVLSCIELVLGCHAMSSRHTHSSHWQWCQQHDDADDDADDDVDADASDIEL